MYPIISLNSIMVRLKFNSQSCKSKIESKSQFHYGSIEIYKISVCENKIKRKSQFHYGSIEILLDGLSIIEENLNVSIPLWFD